MLESELQGAEDDERRQKREELARKEQVVVEAVQEMRFVCDVCGNKSCGICALPSVFFCNILFRYKNVTDYTNHLDSCVIPLLLSMHVTRT